MILRFSLLVLLVIVALMLNLCLGAVSATPQEALQVLFSPSLAHGNLTDIIWQIRLPRLLCAFAVGAALAVSGYLLQSLSRNYLADPYLTGISSGAALAVAGAIVFNASFAALPIVALIGGLLVSLLVAFMARTPAGLSMTRLLLAGIAVSAVCSSLITLCLTTLAGAGRVQALYYWLAGSINGKGWIELRTTSIYLIVGFAVAIIMSKPLRMLSLGAQSAASLGLNIARVQWTILLTGVVLCGAAVSLSGIVGFVGLVAPYVARTVFGRDERMHLCASVLGGGALVLFSDLASRTLISGMELPLGTLLSLIGAPFFLWLVVKHKDEVEA
ncbi:MAG TPA: iron ABC transporter permease [Candidatus Obscuribacterales bacterium]